MEYRIAFANEKGGVAKTTTTLSIGAVFAEAGYKVLLIDLDPQANLSLATGLEPGRIQKSSASLLLESNPANSIVRSTNVLNLDIIPSNNETGLAERFLPGKPQLTLLPPPCNASLLLLAMPL